MGSRVFVGNLHPQTSREELEELLATSTEVAAVRIALDRHSGRPQGFAIVEFRDAEEAARAVRIFDGAELSGHHLRLRPAFDEVENHDRSAIPEADEDDRRTWSPGSDDEPDYAPKHRGRSKRGGKHGSDRLRGRGTRRVID